MLFHARDKILTIYSLLLLLSATVSYILFQSGDPARCRALLREGFWLDPGKLTNWQPKGCMLHAYREREAGPCLLGRRLVFVGGSSTVALFEAVAKKFDHDFKIDSGREREDRSLSLAGTKLQFYWDPYLEHVVLREIAFGFEDEHQRPALTFVGAERDNIVHLSNLTAWAERIDSLASNFSSLQNHHWFQTDMLVISPLLETSTMHLPQTEQLLMTQDKVKSMNDILAQAAVKHNIELASAYEELAKAPGALVSGGKIAPQVASVMADILLNRRCNVDLPKRYPHKSTCCNEYASPNILQKFAALLVFVLMPMAISFHHLVTTERFPRIKRNLPSAERCYAILAVCTVVTLCYLCDRTNVFGKEQKQTAPIAFFAITGLILAASLSTLQTADTEQPPLNRDQTDEWKGWMLVMLLVSHYLGASKTDYIYNFLRMCPTSFLWMAGFGHTTYFLKTSDFTFQRVVVILLRLNLLNVLLAYALNTDWLLYYFGPLITCNFLIVYILLSVGHRYNKNMWILATKIAIGIGLSTAYYRIPGFLESSLLVFRSLCATSGDVKQWRSRIMLDQYSVFFGMAAAALYEKRGSFSITNSKHWPNISHAAGVVSALALVSYAFFASTQPNRIAYHHKHPYISWIPCLAYIVGRNSTSWLRKTHNKLFALLGKGWLETFVLHYHLWLAADSSGLLILGPANERLLNAILTTPILLFASSVATRYIPTVIAWMIDPGAPLSRPPAVSFKSHPHVPTLSAAVNVDPTAPTVDMVQTVSGHAKKNSMVTISELKDPSRLEENTPPLSPSNASGETSSAPSFSNYNSLPLRAAVLLIILIAINWAYYL